ncbi:hypothetical protein [Streptomyces sp. TS71-3]|uniref:hypothetical protein n=1 Tax=Streptomyces sp. TS71-3 TaxID=2733862 RepID=UPI001BB3A57F|nr:hypothetical protein [Streptomyces sp. TS71-3]
MGSARPHGYSLLAWEAEAPGVPVNGEPGAWFHELDEHVVADVDGLRHGGCGEGAVRGVPGAGCAPPHRGNRDLCDQADVLLSGRPRSPLRSVEAAVELAAGHAGCLLAAVPRTDGGWSVARPAGDVHHVRTAWRSPAGAGAANVRAGGTAGAGGAGTGSDTGDGAGADGARRSPAVSGVGGPSHPSPHLLLPSCLHAWLVAGRNLGELASATVLLRC